jgi:putative endonuclease
VDEPGSTWWVYIVETASGKLYTGITIDPGRRLAEHRSGKKGARFFRLSPASKMVYLEAMDDRSAATRREMEIKKMRRPRKLALIASSPASCAPQES